AILLSNDFNLVNMDFINRYRQYIISVAEYKDILAITISYIRSNVCALAHQNKLRKYRTQVEQLSTKVREVSPYLERQREILKQNLAFAKKINWDNLTKNGRALFF